MAITIQDHMLPDDTHNLYDVNFFGDIIHTLLTHDPTMVSQWLSEIQSNHPENRRLIIGLDVEWRPNFNRNTENPVATLQLCVDRRCLIYQLIHSPSVPPSLIDFLSNQNYTFVGIGIKADLEKLEEDYGFGFNANNVDLRKLAADTYQMKELNNAGLKNLAKVVLGKEVNKPSRVTMSRWDYRWLKPDQVQYACVDAFVSFEIGRVLNAAG
ncbi:Werner Syndrome-like exonuclease [Olea europaea var. sylvestris]|uniref:Werner Syndrome-like exonuclease n=1 Tax=Olea europaea subsp. europaea TaxID=158383 RepID=A0A8S0S724_OLEEU|nr:Werner Syndrome-like exonuclease [Olea europaea var. sylvestris]CAA2971155.1 Werner Syndrome-like exonuclease [Olea europaea subsp. europaea]CAA2987493.1 Werner Syndrome-like exonuclease [Olea europaea subsp. europaea]